MARKGDRTVTGAYSADDGTKNPVADSAFMKRQESGSYDYSKFSIGRTVNDRPRPKIQNRGNVTNGD